MAREIVIKVVLDTSELERGTEKIRRSFKSATDAAATNVNALRTAVTGLTSALTIFGGVAAFKQIAQFGIELDKARNAMTALTGSTEKANAKLKELRDLAKASPGVTTTFATQLFQQLKAVGGITDQTINTIIKSLGKLNTVISDVGPEFTRNLIQIFQQGFERADIKEALGKVPIFEQLLKAAFPTAGGDPEKLRKLKDSGKLTLETFLTGFASAIDNDQRFKNIQESLGGKLQKSLEDTKIKLGELGERMLRDLLPVLDKLIPALNAMLDVFTKLPDTAQAAAIGILLVAPAINSVAGAIGGLKIAMVALGGFLTSPAGIAALGLLGLGVAATQLQDLIQNQIPANVRSQLNPQGLTIDPRTKLPLIPGADTTFTFGGKLKTAAAASSAAAKAARGGARRDRGITFPSLTAEDLVSSQFEGEEEFRARAAAIARGRDTRRALTLALGASEDATFRRERLEQGRLSRAALTFEFEQAEKAQKALAKNEQLLSNSARFMKGFAEATLSVGDAFDRFGASVAHAFGNVRDLFGGLKRAVLDFFNDLIGSTLQNLVRGTLGSLFGGISAPASISGGNIFRTPSTFPG